MTSRPKAKTKHNPPALFDSNPFSTHISYTGFRKIFSGGAQASRESKAEVGSTETGDRKPTCLYVQVRNRVASAAAGVFYTLLTDGFARRQTDICHTL